MPFPRDPRLAQMDEDIRTVVFIKDGELKSPDQFTKTDVAWLLDKYFDKRYSFTDELATQVQRRLSYIADKKDGFIVRYKEKGKVRKGIYTLRKTKPQNTGASKTKPPKTATPPTPIDNGTIELPESPIVDTCPSADTYLGKAGEMAVSSELLYRGYNISLMAVDDGIDIVAIKSNKTFLIQVKTMTSHDNKTFRTHIKRSSFDRYRNGDCFYVFVLRRKEQQSIYVVMCANEIDGFISKGTIRDNLSQINLSFRYEAGKIKLGQVEDISHMKGKFDKIR